jgi:hypothetical protein
MNAPMTANRSGWIAAMWASALPASHLPTREIRAT